MKRQSQPKTQLSGSSCLTCQAFKPLAQFTNKTGSTFKNCHKCRCDFMINKDRQRGFKKCAACDTEKEFGTFIKLYEGVERVLPSCRDCRVIFYENKKALMNDEAED
jgi:hypothetical protein